MTRIAVIGLGGIAQKAYLPILANLANVELIFQTRNATVLKSLMNKYHVLEGTTQLDELIALRPDAAFVCAATEAHYDICKALLSAKIAIHLDKPISLSLAESRELVELAAAQKTPFMIGFNRRFVPYIQEALEKGRPDFIVYQKNRYLRPDNIRHFIIDDFIHVIDTTRYMLQAPIKQFNVHATTKGDMMRNISLQLITARNHAICLMDYENGRNEENIELVFKNEKAIIRQLSSIEWVKQNQSTENTQSDWTPTLSKRGFEAMITSFIDSISHQSPLKIDSKDALASHELAEEIILAIEALAANPQ
jgi:virulence factor